MRTPLSWLPQPDSDPTLLYWFNSYQEKNLKLVGLVDAHRDSSMFHWEEPNMRVGESTIIAVYRRETGR